MKQMLNELWKMKSVKSDKWIKAEVPGSVYNDLLNANLISEPFYRENEYEALDVSNEDYEYETKFDVNEGVFNDEKIFLVFDGLDTITSIELNEVEISKTYNMYRKYVYEVKGKLKKTDNSLKIKFISPLRYAFEKNQEDPIWATTDSTFGISHVRKAHYMYGWDWGPKLPDMGIWRDVYLESYSKGKIKDVYITQNHSKDLVDLDIRVDIEKWTNEQLDIEVRITSPDGDILNTSTCNSDEKVLKVSIENPKLWWPNNMGGQPLYNVEVLLLSKDKILDIDNKRIGLRTLTVKQEKDEWGESFEVNVNSISIFSMGADYIPEDNILARCNKEKTEKLIKSCVDANMNSIRIWGGGYYPEDYFFDLCDEYGLIVWHDLMFACAIYRMTDDFTDNITREVRDNVRRIRHHASLGLWCGNNEMEEAYLSWPGPKECAPELKTDYIKQFEFILPALVKEEDPNTFYWKSSPSSGGHFDDPNSENRGDVHDWNVWHGLEPFTYFQDHYYRFLSEFGIQSFPHIKTIEAVTKEEDRNIFSPVMENHQKNGTGNSKILHYVADNYKYPKDFEHLVYASQLIQAEGIKYAVEHLRRHRGRCMGAVYWQLNDCWPVASWASVDYYGRWKALHYSAKRFFNPLLISVVENKRKEDLTLPPSQIYYPVSEHTGARIFITNDTLDLVDGRIYWSLRDSDSNVILDGQLNESIEALSAKEVINLDFTKELSERIYARSRYLEYKWVVDNKTVSKGSLLFVKPKHFSFNTPNLKVDVTECENCFILNISSDTYAKYVEIDLKENSCTFSDNFFDISGGETYQIECLKESLDANISLQKFKDDLVVRSIIDIE